MRKVLLTLLVFLLTLFVLSGCKTNGNKKQSSSTVSSTDTEVADTELIYGDWQIEYYSFDNEKYSEYSDSEDGYGMFTFFDNGTAQLRYNANNINTYDYNIVAEKNVISFSDIETGTNTDFYFGYSFFTAEGENRLLISNYNAVDNTTMYLILVKAKPSQNI